MIDWVSRRSGWILFLLIVAGSARIVSTYAVFSATYDEPSHLARGIEWLDRGTYTLNTEHTPLSGLLVAILPYLDGARSAGKNQAGYEGLAILGHGEHYDRILTFARLGTLPSYWLAMVVVYAWAFRLSGPLAAIFASLLFGALPTVLGHAGLATTDMLLTATLGLSILSSFWWLDKPNLCRSLVFGFTIALAVVSKLSALVFFPVGILSMLSWYLIAYPDRIRESIGTAGRLVRPSLAAGAAAVFFIWMTYRFSFGPVHLLGIRLPAPEFFSGIGYLGWHNSYGHASYLFGRCRDHGFWYFYPVSLSLKTPIGFAVLTGGSIALFLGRWRRADLALPLSFAGGILLFSMLFSNINIGVRHIEPVYFGLSIAAGIAAAELLGTSSAPGPGRWIAAAALLWFLLAGAAAHPDYLAYTNEIAGREPERFLAESDLDWGQDVKRLARRLDQLGVKEVTFDPFTLTAVMAGRLSPIAHPTDYSNPAPGWNAVSVSFWKLTPCTKHRIIDSVPLKIADQPWPDRVKPVERVGRTILLYYFPPIPSAGRPAPEKLSAADSPDRCRHN